MLKALSITSLVSFVVLVLYWTVDMITPENLSSPSGWWWFGCLLIGIFCEELDY